MSFDTLKKDALLKIAEDFAVEVGEKTTREEIIAALAEDGVTWEMVKAEESRQEEAEQAAAEAAEEAERKAAVVEGPTALLRMNRDNFSFQIRGYTFTKSHPFAVVDDENARWIVKHVEGFRYASPEEVEEFYG